MRSLRKAILATGTATIVAGLTCSFTDFVAGNLASTLFWFILTCMVAVLVFSALKIEEYMAISRVHTFCLVLTSVALGVIITKVVELLRKGALYELIFALTLLALVSVCTLLHYRAIKEATRC